MVRGLKHFANQVPCLAVLLFNWFAGRKLSAVVVMYHSAQHPLGASLKREYKAGVPIFWFEPKWHPNRIRNASESFEDSARTLHEYLFSHRQDPLDARSRVALELTLFCRNFCNFHLSADKQHNRTWIWHPTHVHQSCEADVT